MNRRTVYYKLNPNNLEQTVLETRIWHPELVLENYDLTFSAGYLYPNYASIYDAFAHLVYGMLLFSEYKTILKLVRRCIGCSYKHIS